MVIVQFHVRWSSEILYIFYSSPLILATATILWGCAVCLEKPAYPHYTTFFAKQSFECCEELPCDNDDHFKGFNEVGNQDPCSLVSDSMVIEKTEMGKFSLGLMVASLYGAFLGTEFSGHNKLTFIGICCHTLWSWTVDVLAAAKEPQGGWHALDQLL